MIGKTVSSKSLVISNVPWSYVVKLQRDINSCLLNVGTSKVKYEVIQKSRGLTESPNFFVNYSFYLFVLLGETISVRTWLGKCFRSILLSVWFTGFNFSRFEFEFQNTSFKKEVLPRGS